MENISHAIPRCDEMTKGAELNHVRTLLIKIYPYLVDQTSTSSADKDHLRSDTSTGALTDREDQRPAQAQDEDQAPALRGPTSMQLPRPDQRHTWGPAPRPSTTATRRS